MKKGFLYRLMSFALVPAAFFALYLWFQSTTELAEKAVRLFSRPARDFLGDVTVNIPFSVAEVLEAAAVIYVAVYLIRTVAEFFKGDFVKILKRTLALVVVAGYIGAGYFCLWGIDYRAPSFREREGFSTGVEADKLCAAAEYFVEKASALASAMPRDENGSFSGDAEELLKTAPTIYGAVQARFASLAGVTRTPKAMLTSDLMSMTGFTGIYFPYTGESNVNVAQPAIFVPMTAAHELAHQLGVTSEDACNFLGVTACVTSGDEIYTYSGYLNGSIYLMNAVYSVSQEKYSALWDKISPEMAKDLSDNNEYWATVRESKAAKVATDTMDAVYDTYLKVNGVDSGIKSYGECVDLIVQFYLQGGYQ